MSQIKILLIKRGAIGDILMSTPLIRQLHKNLPDATIDFCLANSFKDVLKNNRYIDHVIALDDKYFTSRGIVGFIKFAILNRSNYDYVFILGKSWIFNLLCKIFKGIIVGYAREAISRLFLNKVVVYNKVERYHALYYLDLLWVSGLANPDYADIGIDLTVSDIDKNIVLSYTSQLGSYVVVVNSGGNNHYESGGLRMLPTDKVVDLLSILLKKSQTVILLGGKIDYIVYTKYCELLNNPPNLLNWAGLLSLFQSAFLISQSKHFYTTDCGAMHLGVAMNMRDNMSCFFGPTHPLHVLPNDRDINIYWNDQDTFDKNYPLSGKVGYKGTKYFSGLQLFYSENKLMANGFYK